jgi:hypothetical protein
MHLPVVSPSGLNILFPSFLKLHILLSIQPQANEISVQIYMDASQILLNELPPDIEAMLRKHEDAGTLDNAKYQQAKKFFLTKHMCRITPLPEDLMASLVGLQKDPTVNHTMYFLSFPF